MGVRVREDSLLGFRCFVLLIVLMVPHFPLLGQTGEPSSDEKPLEIEKVIITATRSEEELLDVPGHATIITEEEIRASGARNLADVLDFSAGVSISDFGPEGSEKSVSLRGSATGQVLVLIDGTRANNAQNGVVDLSLIPLENIERIEIVRGGTSALYGADAVGGVVNIITKREPSNEYTLRVSLENGSYLPAEHRTGLGADESNNKPDYLDLVDTQKAKIQFSHDLGGLYLNMAGSFVRAENGFVFVDSNNNNRKRENAELLGGDLWLAARLPLSMGFVDLSGSYVIQQKGVPGLESAPSPDAEEQDQQIRSMLRFRTERLFTDLLTLDINTHFGMTEISFENPDPLFPEDSKHTLYSVGAEVVQEALFLEPISFVYGGSFGYDTLDSSDLEERDRFFGGAFLETPLYIGERLTLVPAVRFDYYSDFYGAFGFKLGSAYRLTDSLSLKASVSRSFRAPTFNDLYWPAFPWAEGNPDLDPETAYNGEIGITLMTERLQWDSFLFVRYVLDAILWQEVSPGFWRPENFGEALFPGIEQQLRYRILDPLTINISYTFLYSFALSGKLEFGNNKRLPMIPIHDVDFGFTLQDKLNTFSASAHYESLRYLDTSNDSFLPSHFFLDLHYRRNLSESFSFFLAADNIFGEQYETVADYPMPGTMIRTGVEAEL
jgi:outer membrane cobalamin receptor